MRRTFARAVVVAVTLAETTASASSAGDDAGVSSATAALRFTEWTMIHTMGDSKGIDPSVVIRVTGQPERPMHLMSCNDRPFGSYTHICARFQRCVEVPKETWRSMIGDPPSGTLLVAACAYPLHFYVVRQDGDRVVALRRKTRRAKRDAGDAGSADGGAPMWSDPFCPTCAATPIEDWQESRSLPIAPGTNVTILPAERVARKWDLD